MNSKSLLSALAVVAAGATPSLASAQECRLVEATPEVISRLPTAPSYFTKVHASGEFAFYIGFGNHVLHLEDRNPDTRDLRIPGSIDPVPSSDGLIVTTPGLHVYLVADVLRDGEDAQELFSDSSHGGVYQSIATLVGTGDVRKYRVITDVSGEVRYRDYEIDYSQTPPAVEMLGQVAKLCPGKTYKTIMISKTGKYVGVYDPRSGTSKLVTGDGQCREVMDLGYPTGKIEFSYDDKRIAFHVDYLDTQAGGYFSGVSSYVTKDVFVLDLVEQADGLVAGSNLRRLGATLSKGSGGYYPSFDGRGRVNYVQDKEDVFSFYTVHPDDVEAYAFTLPPPEGWPNGTPPAGVPTDWQKRMTAAAAIGSLWIEECRADLGEELTAVDAASTFMALPQAECERLVNERFLGERERLSQHARFARDTRFDSTLIAQLQPADILPLCRDNRPVARTSRVYGQEIREVMDGPRVLHNYCVGCHDGPALRRPDGSSVPNPLDFHELSESQIMASLARINLAEGNEYRMPPDASYFPPAFTVEGQLVDHRQVAIDYLTALLTERRAAPPELANVPAPAGTSGCYTTAENWLAYRDNLGYRVSTGAAVSFTEVKQKLAQCSDRLEELHIEECFDNLEGYAKVQTLGGGGRRLDFEMTDLAYYQSIPQEAVSMPTAAEGIDLTDGVPENWAALVEAAPNVDALPYRSRTVVNPGGAGSLNRLLFLVEGERYDKWVQFTLPEPDLTVSDDEYDPTGLVHGSGPEQLVDFIAVDKSVTPHKIYFAQFWRNAQGRAPRPRLKAYRDAYGIAPKPGDVDSADTCYSCHPSGMRSISAMPGSIDPDYVPVLELYNAKMAAYLQAAPIDWAGAITPSAYGPPRGEREGCVTCHNNGEPGRLAALRQGPITYKMAGGHLAHKVVTDLSMPVERYIHNTDDASNPTPVAVMLGYAASTNLLPPEFHVPLAKRWVGEQTGGSGSGYPSLGQVFDDLQSFALFARDLAELFGSDNPYLSPGDALDHASLRGHYDRLLGYRQGMLQRMQDPTRTRRNLGRWIQQSCQAQDVQ